MKLFQKLLVAPAALSLLAPIAANAGGEDHAAATKVAGTATSIIGGTRCQEIAGIVCPEAIYNQYSYTLDTSTSFNGSDALSIKIEGGNDSGGDLGTDNSVATGGAVRVTEAYYTRPVGNFILSGGPLYNSDSFVATNESEL